MANGALTWNQTGDKLFEAGVDHCALYVMKDTITNNGATGADIYDDGVAWNGITSINEGREGGEPQEQWADNIKYISILSAEEFNPTIEAYTYPDAFAVCDGSAAITGATGLSIGQQKRKAFALVYRTKIGNDVDELDHGFKIHIVYNAKAQPAERNYETINESPEGMTLSWECTTTPIDPNYNAVITGMRPTAHIELDSTKVASGKMTTILEKLYGTANSAPQVLLPHEIVSILTAA